MFTIPYLDTNPVAQAEMRRLRHTNHLSLAAKVGLAVLYLLIVLVAFSPYVYYITWLRRGWFAVIAITVLGFQAYITLRTAAVITCAPLPHTELLTLTPMSRWQMVVGKWWGGFKTVWPWYVLAAIPKVGLSLGVMGYLHAGPSTTSSIFIRWLTTPYVYYSGNILDATLYRLYPMGWLMALLICMAFCFAVLNAALLTAIGVHISTHQCSLAVFRLISYRFSLLIVFLVMHMILVAFQMNYKNTARQSQPDRPLCEIVESSQCGGTISYQALRNRIRLSETHIVGLGTVVDSGIMLQANMMRHMSNSKRTDSKCFWMGYCDGMFSPTMGGFDPNFNTSYRQRHLFFLLRHMASAAYGMALHVMLTLGFLRLAARRHP